MQHVKNGVYKGEQTRTLVSLPFAHGLDLALQIFLPEVRKQSFGGDFPLAV